jgi:hypothetical protein
LRHWAGVGNRISLTVVSYDVPLSVLPQTAAPAPGRKRKQTTKQKKKLKIKFHSVFYDVSRRIITNLSFDGDIETIDGSLGAVSLTKDASSETDANFCKKSQ